MTPSTVATAPDTLAGGDGNDLLISSAGNDHCDGGAGSDTLVSVSTSSAYNQVFDGGADNTFAWLRSDVVNANGSAAGFDHITDFGAGDKLDFTQLFNNAQPAIDTSILHVTDTAGGTHCLGQSRQRLHRRGRARWHTWTDPRRSRP